jgi:hypothetical protein
MNIIHGNYYNILLLLLLLYNMKKYAHLGENENNK